MKSSAVHSVLVTATTLPVDQARRVVGVLAKDAAGEMPAELQAVRKALTADLQPLGEAMFAAYQAGDFGATLAALKRISGQMPQLVTATNLQQVMEQQDAAAWLRGNTEPLS